MMNLKERNARKKYPSHRTFKWYNANTFGRLTGDCVVRALSVVLEKPWAEILKDLTALSLCTGYMLNSKECYTLYLELHGLTKQKQPRKKDNTKYTGADFCNSIKFKSVTALCFAHIGGNHAVAIKDHKVHDIWDSTNKTIGNYWVKTAEVVDWQKEAKKRGLNLER